MKSLSEIKQIIADRLAGPVALTAASDAVRHADRYREIAKKYRALAIELRMQLAKNSYDGAKAWVDERALSTRSNFSDEASHL